MQTVPKIAAVLALPLVLSACETIDTDAERAAVGAGGGLLAAEATGVDPLIGAGAGALAGAACDDLEICE